MKQGAIAGLVYFAVIFAAGFVLGTIRVLLLAPAFGEWAAVLLELPVMLALSWFVCGWVIRRHALGSALRERITMAVVAFALLMGAEFGLAVALFGQAMAAYAADLATPVGLLGLAGQLCFALFPLLRMR